MMKILIAEDEIYARKSMKKQIMELDFGREFHILEAQNGEQGLALFRQEEPDLVFTDIRMPKMDGLELLREIKREDPEAKVIMVSAYADFEYAKSAIKFGAEGYLLKPIEDAELEEFLMKFRQQSTRKKEHAMFSGKDI
ncbi:MAG: response regulator, partial [Blautia coccoides]